MASPIERRVDKLVSSEIEKGRQIKEVVVKGQEIKLIYGDPTAQNDDFDMVDFSK